VRENNETPSFSVPSQGLVLQEKSYLFQLLHNWH